MMLGMEYFTRSISLDTEVWEALGMNPLSANQLLRVALGLDAGAKPSKRRLSRLGRAVKARGASISGGKVESQPVIKRVAVQKVGVTEPVAARPDDPQDTGLEEAAVRPKFVPPANTRFQGRRR